MKTQVDFNTIKNYMLTLIKCEIYEKNFGPIPQDEIKKYAMSYNNISFTECKTLEEIAEDMAREYFFFMGQRCIPMKCIPMKGDKEDELPFG